MSQTPRAKFIAEADDKKVAARAWDAMIMASTHDPDLLRRIVRLENLVSAILGCLPEDMYDKIDKEVGI